MEKIFPIAMGQSAFLPGLATQHTEVLDAPRQSPLVHITHWIHAASFIALLISEICLLVAYLRMHGGETGTVGTPSLVPACRNISSGRIRAALQGGPIVIRGLGCPLRLSFLLLFCPWTQGWLTGTIVLHLASQHGVMQSFFHVVKFRSRDNVFRPIRQDGRNFLLRMFDAFGGRGMG